jgi:hypothetical protein
MSSPIGLSSSEIGRSSMYGLREVAGAGNVGSTAECQIQVRAEDIRQQGVQREYHVYNCADRGWPLARCGKTLQDLETSRPGIFSAVDVRSGSVKRVAAAVGERAAAIQAVHQYLARCQ